MNNEYLKLVAAAQKKRIEITKDSIKQIRDLYKDVAKDLSKRARSASKGSLNQRWLKDYGKQLKSDIKELNKILKPDIENSMLKSAEGASSIQLDFFNMLGIKYSFNNKESFSSMFSNMPKDALAELTNGGFYKDGRGLSQRLWAHNGKANADFDYIIEKGIAEKKSTYGLANDLADFVNPEVRKSWDFKKIYPGVGNKKIEYNSLRLAITSISHAYQLSLQRSCKANPFVEGIQWNISNSHRGTCGLCKSRDKKIYKADDLPLDHPMGVCYFTPVVEKSMEDIGTELNSWVNGGNNTKLDGWYREYGSEFI
ncbi:hypothetical protein [Clostridium estertheticum]|uniref:Phage head morphogenesis domain-containing protein n=1 Tax=Clostridium estertheticum TaxID=238834 RepID=A0AA47I8A5_9CLOT|nr:hypothetical protein [Clostridium estertheticum]MBU3155170.1 hypothetical protein [Clostridium estertheticum]WAG61224.1 hypothetical protein LL038_02950 [Clostridium estertheticum]